MISWDNRMMHGEEIRQIKQSLIAFVESLERPKKLLGKEMEAYSSLKTNTQVVNAFHKVQVCTGHNVDALLELDMELQDLLDERSSQ
jgi:hypothetical protein